MKETEAREILGMLKAATTQYPLDDETIGFWIDGLTVLDAEHATKAVLIGIREWERFPAWAAFYEAYRVIQRQAKEEVQREEAARQAAAESVRKGKPPEWVWVWSWAQFHRDPAETRPFPQQIDWVDPTTVITADEYETLRKEWIAKGCPKETPLPIGGVR